MLKILNKTLTIKILLLLMFVLVLALYAYLKNNIPGHLVINEIAFDQEDGVDWIEIYNPTLNNLSMEGMYLSDKADNYSKFRIKEELIVPSHGYVLIYGDGYETDAEGAVVANFRVANGEVVYLVDDDGSTLVDSLTALKNDENSKNVTTGRFPDGTDEIFIMSQATPSAANQKDMIKEEPNFKRYE